QPSQAGISLTTDAKGVTARITSIVGGAPVISSPTTADAAPGQPFSYQINATNNPTSFGATNLPTGLSVNHTTGYITGTPKKAGAFIVPINANNGAGSAQADLTINVDPVFAPDLAASSNLLNISTRLDIQTGDNVLIDGFIITGTSPKKVLIRGLGPSLTAAGVDGALADPVLELHKFDGSIVTNDNWMDTQKAAIIATGIPPTDNHESAIVAILAPGAYTAIESGKNNGPGIGLVEVYDLDQAAASELANISTRGLVQTGDNIMIGGFIIGGGGGGSSTVVVRGIGPSLGSADVADALQDPTLELHDGNGAVVGFDDNWQDAQKAAITADKLAPTNPKESAIEATLAPGNYTAVLRGKNDGTGVGLVEAYNLH
ncbi:MAG: Ig domain-containing protein, partial [Bryobacteraceae bacterium]